MNYYKLFTRLLLPVFILIVLIAFCRDRIEPGNKIALPKFVLDSAQLINDLAYLSSAEMSGRESGTPGNQLARAFIAKRYESLKLKAPDSGVLQPFSFPQHPAIKGANVIAMIPGTTYPDQYYVLSAHYDHLGTRNGKIYYGADDNASGVAGLLALAAYFKQHPPKHSFIIAAFDGEEKGLKGSKYFVEHAPVDLKKIALNINMDMISRNDKNEIYASGTSHYPFLKKYIDSIKPPTSVTILTGHDNRAQGRDDWTNQSDHYSFHKTGIPYIYFGVEDHADYHKPTDTFDKIDKRFFYRVCNMVREAIALLDRPKKFQ